MALGLLAYYCDRATYYSGILNPPYIVEVEVIGGQFMEVIRCPASSREEVDELLGRVRRDIEADILAGKWLRENPQAEYVDYCVSGGRLYIINCPGNIDEYISVPRELVWSASKEIRYVNIRVIDLTNTINTTTSTITNRMNG